mmetsp:Transcript_14174/g.38965  ORF Transcript_14174/g.38965 Transcript_14174/m.38965 type:complete len:402 (-) Transcript_14174:171-1376(-)
MTSGYPSGGPGIFPAPGLSAGPPGISRSPPGEAPPPPPAGLGAIPPALWQPPGFGGLGAGASPPATGPAAGGANAASAGAATSHGAIGEGRDLELQKEITGTIEAQVQRLLEQARHDTESKVKMELKGIRDSMLAIDASLDQLLAQLDGIEAQEPAEGPMDAEAVGQLLSKIEQQWGQVIRTLKQELHQTILAHNHNADLIKHHKDTIDALRERCVKMQNSNAKTSEIQQQLQKLDARLKQQQKHRKIEPLFERLSALEQRVAAAATQGAAAWRYPGVPPMVPPGMSMPPGISQGMMPGMGAKAASLMAAVKGAKGAGFAPGGAPFGAATMVGDEGCAASSGKAGEKAAFKCPTDEEVQARLSKLCVSTEASTAQAGGGIMNDDEAAAVGDDSTEEEAAQH